MKMFATKSVCIFYYSSFYVMILYLFVDIISEFKRNIVKIIMLIEYSKVRFKVAYPVKDGPDPTVEKKTRLWIRPLKNMPDPDPTLLLNRIRIQIRSSNLDLDPQPWSA